MHRLALLVTATQVTAAAPVSALLLAQSAYAITTETGSTIEWERAWDLDTSFAHPASRLDAMSFSDGIASLTIASVRGYYDIDPVRGGLLIQLDDAGTEAITIDRSAYEATSHSLDLLDLRMPLTEAQDRANRAGLGSCPAAR